MTAPDETATASGDTPEQGAKAGGFAASVRRLVRRPFTLALILIVSVAVAIFSGYRLESNPTKLVPRSTEYGFAANDLLVDSPNSVLTNTRADLAPVAARAEVFAILLASDQFRASLARRLKVSPEAIALQVLQDGQSAGDNADAQDQLQAVTAAGAQYKLTFKAVRRGPQGSFGLPVIAVTGTAPTAAAAERLVNASGLSAAEYAAARAARKRVKKSTAAQIRAVGQAQAATINSSVSKAVVVAVFIVAFCALAVFVLAFERFLLDFRAAGQGERSRRKAKKAAKREPSSSEPDESVSEPGQEPV